MISMAKTVLVQTLSTVFDLLLEDSARTFSKNTFLKALAHYEMRELNAEKGATKEVSDY